jgi:hypothetical protein
MSGRELPQDPKGAQRESGGAGKKDKESRSGSFREWINTTAGLASVVVAVLALGGGATVITVQLATSPKAGSPGSDTPAPAASTPLSAASQRSIPQGSAGAPANAQFCANGYNTCLTYPYPANVRFVINPTPYISDVFSVTGAWASETSAAAGTYAMDGNNEPSEAVSDISLGAAANDQYTCLSFRVNATSSTVYAHQNVDSTGWALVTYNCM